MDSVRLNVHDASRSGSLREDYLLKRGVLRPEVSITISIIDNYYY